MSARVAAGILSLAVIGSPGLAFSFGGVFTSEVATTINQPLDLRMARVVFEVDPGEITAHVQLSFDGSERNIAWVLPVEEVPTVTEGSVAFLDQMENETRLGVKMPASEPCVVAMEPTGTDEGGCSCGDPAMAPPDPTPLTGDNSEHPPVIMYGDTMTVTYQVRTVGASTSGNLLHWLRTEGFKVSDNMAPAMDAYNRVGMKFVVIQFRNETQNEHTPPLTLRYPGTQPIVPLQLTAVAARPYFGLLVMILANETYTPQNYVTVAPTPSELVYDDSHHISYFDWVARSAADSVGHLFVTEFVGESPFTMGSMVGGVPIRHPYVSRFFTRVSPEHMDEDPRFRIHPNATYRARSEIDLIAEPSLFACNELVEERLPSVCAFNYCGAMGSCGVVDGRVGCVCEAGAVAEMITGPDGAPRVVCAPRVNARGVLDDRAVQIDPCQGTSCGEGACVDKHDRATCDCLPTMVAVLDGNSVTCEAPPVDFETFGPGGGVESRPVTMATFELDRDVTYAGALWILALFALRFRRR